MEFVSIGFENFANFENIYLPLENSVTVLVGKNNSGKTALLNGISSLNSLPLEPAQTLSGSVFGYGRLDDKGRRWFRLKLIFQVSDSDSKLTYGPEPDWHSFVRNQTPKLEYHFVATQGIMCLEKCMMLFDSGSLEVIQRRDAKFFQVFYDSAGQPRESKGVEFSSDRQTQDGIHHPVLRPLGLFGPLNKLKACTYIDSHRVIDATMPLQSVNTLGPHASNLVQFLHTLQGNEITQFQEVESFITRVFPEFKNISLYSQDNRVQLTFLHERLGQRIPVSHCGTGVEQVLCLATSVITSKPGTIFLFDEPHSFLHPSAERELLKLLAEHTEHKYIISTHSPVIINEVSPNAIVHLEGDDYVERERGRNQEVSSVLRALGYRNSDFLFSDRLVFVEGPSDREILPILLKNSGEVLERELNRTGFPDLGGAGRLSAHDWQTRMLQIEGFLEQLGRSHIPRMYLFDGHLSQEDQRLLEKTKGGKVRIRFLPLPELENYLLVSEAIKIGLTEQARLAGVALEEPLLPEVQNLLNQFIESADQANFSGTSARNLATVKGSRLLEQVFRGLNLVYDKRRSGRLIAAEIKKGNQPNLSDLANVVREIF